MHLERLSQRESLIVGDALRASADGPFFPDWEFHTLFGLTREQVRELANAWPTPLMEAETIEVAVNNALNSLACYPLEAQAVAAWPEWVSVDRAKLLDILDHLCGNRQENHFDQML